MKNILLTTLGYTPDETRVRYFHYEKNSGEKVYCSGISMAEAGTKYFLSNYQIDEIVVLGPSEAIMDLDITEKTPILELPFLDKRDFDDFSEYSFFYYRIQQFLDGIDIEGNDIYESISKEEKESALNFFNKYLEKEVRGVRQKDLFDALNKREFSKKDTDRFNENLTMKQWNWLIYKIYNDADSYYKMHALSKNRELSIRFVELKNSGPKIINYKLLNERVSELLRENEEEICLYLDFQGLGFSDTSTLFNLLSIMRNSNKISINGIIESTSYAKKLSSPILDELNYLEVNELRTGVNIFIKYGKTDYLKKYIERNYLNSPELDKLMTGMQYVEEGSSLCNIPVLKYGIDVIRKTFVDHDPKLSNDIAYKILAETLKVEYGKLLEGDEIDIIELLSWTIDNQMYQQALTIVESQIPASIVKQGIFYYAQNDSDIEKLMEELNVYYWNESRKTRYMYNDLDHFFIKNYNRNKLNFNQNQELVNKDYAKLRILQLHGKETTLPAYSNLHNDDLLYELLLSYYNLSTLRNKTCHAEPPKVPVGVNNNQGAYSNLEILKRALNSFIDIYKTALKDINKNECVPLRIDGDSFKQYRNTHRLVPFTKIDDNTLENSCMFNFNGKDVSIVVKMLAPEDGVDK